MDRLDLLTQNVCLSKRLSKVVRLIKKNNPDVFCLQEITGYRVAERIRHLTGYDYVISERVGTNFPLMFKHFHNVTFSRFPIKRNGNIVFKNHNLSKKREFSSNVFWADISLESGNSVRIYNCHITPRSLGMLERSQILVDIFKHADGFGKRILICGDMNTMMPKGRSYRRLLKIFHKVPSPDPSILGDYAYNDERHYFLNVARKFGYEETSDINLSTWCIPFTGVQVVNVKLDWILYKGLNKINYELGPWIGDHRSIHGEFQI